MVQDRAVLTMAGQQEVVCGLSNGTIFGDLERPVVKILRFAVI